MFSSVVIYSWGSWGHRLTWIMEWSCTPSFVTALSPLFFLAYFPFSVYGWGERCKLPYWAFGAPARSGFDVSAHDDIFGISFPSVLREYLNHRGMMSSKSEHFFSHQNQGDSVPHGLGVPIWHGDTHGQFCCAIYNSYHWVLIIIFCPTYQTKILRSALETSIWPFDPVQLCSLHAVRTGLYFSYSNIANISASAFLQYSQNIYILVRNPGYRIVLVWATLVYNVLCR